MTNSMSGTTATIGAWLLALSSTEPPSFDRIAGRQLLGELRDLRRELIDDRLRLRVADDAGLQRDGGDPRAPPDRRLLELVAQIGHGAERHGLTAEPGQLQVAQGVDGSRAPARSRVPMTLTR